MFKKTFLSLNQYHTHVTLAKHYVILLSFSFCVSFLFLQVDVAIIEVGLGGTKDSTNVVLLSSWIQVLLIIVKLTLIIASFHLLLQGDS